MFEKYELAAGTEDTGESANSVSHAWDGAEREGADNGVHAGVGQWDFFSGEIEKFQIKLGLATLTLGAREHAGIGFERVKFCDFGGIVEGEVHAGPHADFEDASLREGDDLLANLLDWRRIANGDNDVGIDAVSVEGHCASRCAPVCVPSS